MRRCDVCKCLHDAGSGWAFCEEDLNGVGFLREAADRDWVNQLACLPSRQQREMQFFLLCKIREQSHSGANDPWIVQSLREPLGGYLAVAAAHCLPTVVSTMLGARANPNSTMPPYRSRLDDVFFHAKTPLHCAAIRYQSAPMEARVACVQELLKHKADPQKQDIYGATPLDLLVRSEIGSLIRQTERWRLENPSWSPDEHRECKEANARIC